MAQYFWRAIVAVIGVVFVLAAIPLVFSIIGFPLAANVFELFRICIAAIAIFYILKGPPVQWS